MLFRKLLPGTIGGLELAPFTEHLGYIPPDLLHPPYSHLFYSILLDSTLFYSTFGHLLNVFAQQTRLQYCFLTLSLPGAVIAQ